MKDFYCVQYAVDLFISRIHLAAEASIPNSSGQYRCPPEPLWSDEWQQAVRKRSCTSAAFGATRPARPDNLDKMF